MQTAFLSTSLYPLSAQCTCTIGLYARSVEAFSPGTMANDRAIRHTYGKRQRASRSPDLGRLHHLLSPRLESSQHRTDQRDSILDAPLTQELRD